MANLVLLGPDRKYGATPKRGLRTYRWYIIARWKDEAGRWRKSERATGCGLGERAEAEKRLGEYLVAARDPRPSGPRDPSALSIADALSLYMREHAPHVACPERIGYAAAALLPFWGSLAVSAITGNTCRAYTKARERKGIKPGTIRRELVTLHAACKHCEREGYLTRAPVVVLPEVPPRSHRVFNRGELAAIIRAARNEPRCRDYLPLFILLGAYTGKRSTAIRSLRWLPNTGGDGWIDIGAGMIHWGHSGTKKRRGEPTPIPRPLMSLLRLRARRGGKYVLAVRASHGKPSGPFKTAWRSALRRSGVPHGRIHDLRHTAASVSLSRGVPPWKVAQYLGMSVDTLLRVYSHCIKGALDEVALVVGGKQA